MELKALKDLQALMVQTVLKVLKVLKDLLVMVVVEELKVLKVLKELLVVLVEMEEQPNKHLLPQQHGCLHII